ncbi:BrlA, abaA and wetA [Teratosphaeria destructans]|uniref:BrlA, abaA and wetA n=1 Tax=Teratosphaeria destructans TaxID=418781 RepID=A0A9W7W618_9PEZI|nr:BrlA, abaA and wetA [Teratosphaeria destructans]
MSNTTTPTRHGRGMPLPTIDTASAFQRPMSSLPPTGMLTPPQTCTDSRRGSLASYGCVSDGQLSGTPSVGQYSMPPTPSHPCNDPFSNPHPPFDSSRAVITEDLFSSQPLQHAAIQSAMYSNACADLGRSRLPSGPHDVHQSIEGLRYPAEAIAREHCLPSQNVPHDTNASMLWQATQSLAPSGTFGDSFQSAPYCQPSQVWQVSPIDDSAAQYAAYESDSCPPLDTSFYSNDGNDSKFELMEPPSPDGMYFGCAEDEDYAFVKKEAFQAEKYGSPSFRSPMFGTHPHHGVVKNSPGRRGRRTSSKRGRSNVSQVHVSHGMEVTYEGKWHIDKNGKTVADHPPALKPHVCNHVDVSGRVCTNRFERSEHLKRHQVKHNPKAKERYPCPLHDCKKGISRSDNAGDHIKTHLRETRKGQRNKPKPWNVVRDRLIERYSEKEATKMIAKIEKWIRENPDGKHQRQYLY